MSNYLSVYTHNRDNNFNLIRFIAALLVLYTHSFALAGHIEPLKNTVGMTWGNIAVDVFFVTSGFLITGSYFARNNVLAFAWARIVRIYPGLIVAVLFCVVVGAFFTTLNLQQYFSDPKTFKFLIQNSILFFGIEHHLPGVFMDVPHKGSVNGSLWTLPYEVTMYLVLGTVLWSLAKLNKRIKLISSKDCIFIIGVFSLVFFVINHFFSFVPPKVPKFFAMFFIGAAFYVYKEKIYLSSKWIIPSIFLLLISSLHKDFFFVVYCFSLPFIVFYLAYIPSGKIRSFNKFGDYSYGIYIYAFPIQQSLASVINSISVTEMFLLSFVITLLLSMLSWHLIEKPSLKMKGAYIHIQSYMASMRPRKQ